MKAAVFHQHGPLDNIRYEDYPEPELGPADCLVAVKAVTLNGFDPMVLRGIPGLKTPLPMIPGADVAGEVIETGPEVKRWKKGDRVAVIPNRPRVGMMARRCAVAHASAWPSRRIFFSSCPIRFPTSMPPVCPPPMAARSA